MPSPGTVCSLLLFSVLWADLAMAGSSFLSPEHQKVQQRKESKKPPAKLQPRALEGLIHPEDTSQVEGAEDELEIRKTRGLWASPAFPGAGAYADGTLDRPATASPSLVAPHQPPSVDNDRIGGAYHGSDKSCPRISSANCLSLIAHHLISTTTCEFNAPFDVGIKLSGAQYHQHGQALGKFLQDVLWEEADEVLADE